MTVSQPNVPTVNSKGSDEITSSSTALTPGKSNWPPLPEWAMAHQRADWGDRLKILGKLHRESESINQTINQTTKLIFHNTNTATTYLNRQLEWEGTDDDENVRNEDVVNDNDKVLNYRVTNGWVGSDLMHSKSSPVRILEYRLSYNKTVGDGSNNAETLFPTLTGICHFTKNAESHPKHCHGGSMTSIMDDIIGWTGFCVTGKCIPWSGFTVQINTTLKKIVKVDMILKVVGKVVKTERRKVWIEALLIDPQCGDGDDSIHAKAEGLVILKKGMIDEN